MRKGFTLIELLVVVSIISSLSSSVLVALNSARMKAYESKAVLDARTIATAMEEYYQANQDWPPAGGQLNVNSVNVSGWNSLGSYLTPYLSKIPFPGFPSLLDAQGHVSQGYLYLKGTTLSPLKIQVMNSMSGANVGCVYVYDGYYLSLQLPEQTSLTLHDEGIDPDAFELWQGDVRFVTNPTICL